jgi:hypothetical protein
MDSSRIIPWRNLPLRRRDGERQNGCVLGAAVLALAQRRHLAAAWIPEGILHMTGIEQAFVNCGVIGSVLLVLRFVLPLFGLRPEKLFALPSAQYEIPGGDVRSKLFSFRTIATFLAVFGLAGFLLDHVEETGAAMAIAGGMLAGGAVAWLVALLFRDTTKRGAPVEFRSSRAIGERGNVYVTIPPGGTGKVTVTINSRLTVLDAVAQDKSEMKTGEPIEVIEVVEQDVLLVRKV